MPNTDINPADHQSYIDRVAKASVKLAVTSIYYPEVGGPAKTWDDLSVEQQVEMLNWTIGVIRSLGKVDINVNV